MRLIKRPKGRKLNNQVCLINRVHLTTSLYSIYQDNLANYTWAQVEPPPFNTGNTIAVGLLITVFSHHHCHSCNNDIHSLCVHACMHACIYIPVYVGMVLVLFPSLSAGSESPPTAEHRCCAEVGSRRCRDVCIEARESYNSRSRQLFCFDVAVSSINLLYSHLSLPLSLPLDPHYLFVAWQWSRWDWSGWATNFSLWWTVWQRKCKHTSRRIYNQLHKTWQWTCN